MGRERVYIRGTEPGRRWRVGDTLFLDVWGKWRRGHPVPSFTYRVEVVEVRRKFVAVRFEVPAATGGRRYAMVREFSIEDLEPPEQEGGPYSLFHSRFRHPSWKRRHLVDMAGPCPLAGSTKFGS